MPKGGSKSNLAIPIHNREPNERWRIIKNVLVLGFAFMIHFTAFHGTANLQSSVNTDASLGTFTLSAIYGSLILSNIFLPVIVIRWLGCKWTVALSFIVYMPFVAAQFWPRVYTLIPAGLFVGFGGGPLWCAKCTYLSVAAEAYSQISNVKSEVIVVLFFATFFMFYQMAQVWGNLISSSVLSSSNNIKIDSLNETLKVNYESLLRNETLHKLTIVRDTCGANFCVGQASEDNTNLMPPDPHKIHIIAGIYLVCMVVAVLSVIIGVDSLSRYDSGRQGSGTGLSGFRLLAVTLKQLQHKYQLLLLPITAFIGAEQAFIAADFNAAFVGCTWGISNIGYVMICFGVFNALSAAAAGAMVKLTGRPVVMIIALVLHVSLLLGMNCWKPRPDQSYVLFIFAAIWGTADAVWLVQINALSGILFPGKEEASYSNFRLWEATGSVIAYSYSPYLCTRMKLYFLLLLLIVGITGYGSIEYMEIKAKRGLNLKKDFELVNEKGAMENSPE